MTLSRHHTDRSTAPGGVLSVRRDSSDGCRVRILTGTGHCYNVDLMLVQRRRRWTNINRALFAHIVFYRDLGSS